MTTNSFTQNISQVNSVEEIKQDFAIKFDKIFQSISLDTGHGSRYSRSYKRESRNI